ncbi:MAG: hypothetical protein WCG05_02575 [Alphaproteobacteria bacterium]
MDYVADTIAISGAYVLGQWALVENPSEADLESLEEALSKTQLPWSLAYETSEKDFLKISKLTDYYAQKFLEKVEKSRQKENECAKIIEALQKKLAALDFEILSIVSVKK